jgi:hypothetical protein
MAKTKSLSLVTVMPVAIQQEAKRFLPKQRIESLRLFKQLKEKDKPVLAEIARTLTSARIMNRLSDVAIGECLFQAQELLTPYSKKGAGLYGAFLRNFKFSRRQALRKIEGYRNALAMLTGPALKIASARGWDINGDKKNPLGQFTHAVRLIGPGPTSDDPERVTRWADQVEQTVKERRSRARKSAAGKGEILDTIDSDTATRAAYRAIAAIVKKVNKRSQPKVVERVAGMLLSDLGISHLNVHAEAVPEDYKPQPVGRPKEVKNPEEGEAASA